MESFTCNERYAFKSFSCDPDPSSLVKGLLSTFPGVTLKFCYEAGFCGFWIYREFSRLGYDCTVVNPADIPQTQKEELNKNDTIDSRKLAKALDKNNLTPIYIPSEEEEARRDLFRIRQSLVREQTSTKNKVRSFLNKYNIVIPSDLKTSSWSKKFISWLKTIEFKHYSSKFAFGKLISILESLKQNILELNAEIRKVIKSDTYTKETNDFIRGVPGVGNVCSMSLILELFNMDRFKSDDELLSYIGFTPTTRSSGDREYSRGITFRHKKKLRNILIEAAWIAIRKDPAMLLAFDELCKRMNKNRAIIRIAKKLVKRIRFVWKNRKNYVFGTVV